MRGITFPSWSGENSSGPRRYINLAHVLSVLEGALGPVFADVRWSARLAEVAPEPGAEKLSQLESVPSVSTHHLLQAAASGAQIVDGELRGSYKGSPVVTIRAVDSSSWDVELPDDRAFPGILKAFDEAFRNVTEWES